MRSRFYAPAPWSSDHQFNLPTEVFHHAITVLRMRVDDVCDLFDGQGNLAAAQIIAVDKKSARARWLSPPAPAIDNESPLNITLAQCLSSADKMDWTVEKAVELGVNHIVPIFSMRSQVKLTPERALKKTEHWQRIIIAACAQSGRNVLPTLATPMTLVQYLSSLKNQTATKLILHPDPTQPTTLSQIDAPPLHQPIHILIGPESGFDISELGLVREAGFRASVLGARILRTETAGLATISALQTLWGDF